MKFLRFVGIAALSAVACVMTSVNADAQFGKLGKYAGAGVKVLQAVTLTDAQMASYVKEYIEWMDKNNKVSDANSEYTKRLNSLTEGLTTADGIPLNFKVYEVTDVNAFACPDGSVRVFSSLMDIMSDDELLGVIGHEIGHVAKHHSKKAFRQSLLTSALREGISAGSGRVAALSSSQLGDLGQSLVSASYSKKQEYEADDYGYEFLKSHGKNPAAMALSFQKLKSMQGSGKSNFVNQLFSSHPDLEKRIKRMTERAKKEGYSVSAE